MFREEVGDLGAPPFQLPILEQMIVGGPEGCGTEGFPVRFKIDPKPKDPPIFVGKSNEDVEVWAK